MKSNITIGYFFHKQQVTTYNILLFEVKIYYITLSGGILHKSPFVIKSALHSLLIGKFK